MKTRNGFVSNSSSSSFVVSLAKITARDLAILLNYNKNAPDDPNYRYHDYWNITVDEHSGIVRGFASMDNDDLSVYLKDKGVDLTIFNWEW